MKKLLFVLPADKAVSRIVRRAVIVGVCAFAGVLLTAYVDIAPGYLVPVVTAILASLDKFSREVNPK
jgi:hypothetical protein